MGISTYLWLVPFLFYLERKEVFTIKGLEIAKSIIDNNLNRPILVYFDPDVDGLLSGLLVCQLLDSKGKKYSYFVNDKRKHGFTLNPSTMRGYLIIAVDFNITNDIMQSLVDNDVCIASFDHHDITGELIHYKSDKSKSEGIIINNQYEFEPEDDKYLSGAGVVYEAFCEMYEGYKDAEREALVGISLLSDARPIENSKARKYLKVTYETDAQSGYIGYLLASVCDTSFGFGVPRMDRNFIDYTFSPRVNSLLRLGKETEALNFILGKGLKGGVSSKTVQSDLCDAMKARASYLDMCALQVIAVDTKDFMDYPNIDISSFIGLVCSNIKGTGKSVIGFVIDNGKITRASFRGKYDDLPYLNGIRSLGIKADGHPPAFGIIDFNPTTDTWNEIDELIMQLEENHEKTYKVIDVINLSFTMLNNGYYTANENCYVRDMFRTYFRYKGKNAKIVTTTYKMREIEEGELMRGVKPEKVIGKKNYVYLRDENGACIPKYIEYFVDGKKVKSFGVRIEDGLILPVLEKGHVQLYVKELID